jgi:Sec-independent protein secretion pathway component TatC
MRTSVIGEVYKRAARTLWPDRRAPAQMQCGGRHPRAMAVDETKHLKPQEDDKARVDRELIELLNELRVALPGVQILFAFLLILPFQQGWDQISDIERHVYFAALAASATASALLIAPSVYHRLNFRRHNKEQMLFDSNRILIAGSAFVAIGIACAIFLVADVVYGTPISIIATAVTLALYAGLWGVFPLIRRNEPDD